MTFQWTYRVHGDVEILSLSGHVGLNAPDLVTATAGDDLTASGRHLVVDLAEMEGWGHGRAALVDLVKRLSANRRVMVVDPRDKLTLWALRECSPLEMFPDLDAALDTSQESSDDAPAIR